MKKLFAALLALVTFGLPSSAFASTQIFMGRSTNPTHPSTTVNLTLNDSGAAQASTGGPYAGVLPLAGTFSNLYAYGDAAPGGAASWTVTLEDVTTLKAVTCTITSAATSCADTTHSFTAAAGDVMTIKFTANSSPAASTLYYTIQFTPTTANQTAWMFSNDTGVSVSAENYTPLAGYRAPSATESTQTAIVPEGGTFQNLYVALGGSASPGNYDFTVKDFSTAATTTITCNVSVTTGNDTTHTYVASAPAAGVIGDLLDLASMPHSSPTQRVMGGGIGFTPTTAGDFMLPFVWTVTDGQPSTVYDTIVGNGSKNSGQNTDPTESRERTYADAMTVTSMQISVDTAPGGVTSRTFKLRQNTADSSASCTITGTATSCRWDGWIHIAHGDLVDISDGASSGSVAVTKGRGVVVAHMPTTTPATAVGSKHKIWGGLVKILGGLVRIQ